MPRYNIFSYFHECFQTISSFWKNRSDAHRNHSLSANYGTTQPTPLWERTQKTVKQKRNRHSLQQQNTRLRSKPCPNEKSSIATSINIAVLKSPLVTVYKKKHSILLQTISRLMRTIIMPFFLLYHTHPLVGWFDQVCSTSTTIWQPACGFDQDLVSCMWFWPRSSVLHVVSLVSFSAPQSSGKSHFIQSSNNGMRDLSTSKSISYASLCFICLPPFFVTEGHKRFLVSSVLRRVLIVKVLFCSHSWSMGFAFSHATIYSSSSKETRSFFSGFMDG